MPDFTGLGAFDEEGSREERAFRYWINSLELDDTDLITNLYDACKDGKVLLRVCDKVKPGSVDWPATVGFPTLGSKIPAVRNTFDESANCEQAFLAVGKVIGKPMHGLGSQDIKNCANGGSAKEIKVQRGNLLAMVWQLVRQHYLQILGNKSEKDVLDWCNQQCPEDLKISNFGDKSLGSGVFLMHLVSAISSDKREIDWDNIVTKGEDDEGKETNAKYAITLAKKYGCVIFMIWQDVIECNKKMLLIFMASVFDVANNTNTSAVKQE